MPALEEAQQILLEIFQQDSYDLPNLSTISGEV